MRSGHLAQRGTEKSDGDSPTFPDPTCRENASESLSDMSTLLNNFREKTSRAGLVRSAPADRSRRPLCFPVMGLRKSFCYPFTCPRELACPDASQPGGASSRSRTPTIDPRTSWSPHLARSDASSPPPLPQSGWCHQVGSHLAAHDPTQASRHLECDWRHHDHSHGRARHQARELHRIHRGSRREGDLTPQNPDHVPEAPGRCAPPRWKKNLEPLAPRESRRAPAQLSAHLLPAPLSFNRRCPTSTPWTARTLLPSLSTSTTSSATGSALRCAA